MRINCDCGSIRSMSFRADNIEVSGLSLILALENKSQDWKEYPLIHLDLGDRSSASSELLSSSLTTSVNEAASLLGVDLFSPKGSFIYLFLEKNYSTSNSDKTYHPSESSSLMANSIFG